MQKSIVIQPQARAWLEGSILQPYVSQYGEHLQRRRYAPSTQRAYLRCVAHFAHWLTRSGKTWRRSARAPLCVFSRNTCRRCLPRPGPPLSP